MYPVLLFGVIHQAPDRVGGPKLIYKKKECCALTLYIPPAGGSCHQGTVAPFRKPNYVPGTLQRDKPGLSVGTIKEAVNRRLRAESLYAPALTFENPMINSADDTNAKQDKPFCELKNYNNACQRPRRWQ